MITESNTLFYSSVETRFKNLTENELIHYYGYIAGLFDSDGSIEINTSNYSISQLSIDKELFEAIKVFLNSFGIISPNTRDNNLELRFNSKEGKSFFKKNIEPYSFKLTNPGYKTTGFKYTPTGLKNRANFTSWLLGFTDGDGCFSISINHDTAKQNYVFIISQHDPDILIYIQNKLLNDYKILGRLNYFIGDKQFPDGRIIKDYKMYRFAIQSIKTLDILVNNIFIGNLLTRKNLSCTKFNFILKDKINGLVNKDNLYNYSVLAKDINCHFVPPLRHPIYNMLDYYLDLNPSIDLNSKEVKSHLEYFILGIITFSKYNLTDIDKKGIKFRFGLVEYWIDVQYIKENLCIDTILSQPKSPFNKRMVLAFFNGVFASKGNLNLSLSKRGVLDKRLRLFTNSKIEGKKQYILYSSILNYLNIGFTPSSNNTRVQIARTNDIIDLSKLLLDNNSLVFSFDMPLFQLLYDTLLLYPTIKGNANALNKVKSNIVEFAKVKKPLKQI